MQGIKELLQDREKSLILQGFDPVTAHGFTQVPNVILNETKLSYGARFLYAILLRYAWQESSCFPGQERLAKDLGATDKTVRKFIDELIAFGYLETVRRGLGKTNIYILHASVKRRKVRDTRLER